MNREQWRQFLIEAFTDYRAGNGDSLNLVVEMLVQSDTAAAQLATLRSSGAEQWDAAKVEGV